jgi:hypothetical protein
MKLLRLLFETIEEEIKKKDLLGKGAHKEAYPAVKYNDVIQKGEYVIKKWKKDPTVQGIINREYTVYKKNPDMFAYISKMDFDRNIMIQKKLDTDRAIKEIDILTKELKPLYKLDTENIDYTKADYDNNVMFFIETMAENPNIEKKVLSKINKTDIATMLSNWLTFMKKSVDMDKSYVDRFNKDRTLSPDLHSKNVGYDSDGNIKYIDI